MFRFCNYSSTGKCCTLDYDNYVVERTSSMTNNGLVLENKTTDVFDSLAPSTLEDIMLTYKKNYYLPQDITDKFVEKQFSKTGQQDTIEDEGNP